MFISNLSALSVQSSFEFHPHLLSTFPSLILLTLYSHSYHCARSKTTVTWRVCLLQMRAKLSAIAPTAIAAPRYGEASASESASAAASQLRRRRRHRLITLAHLAGPSRGSIGKSGSRLLALSRDSYPNGSDFRLCCFYCCCRCCFGLFSGVGGHIYQAQWPHGLCRFSLSAFLSEMLVIKPQFVNFLGSCGGAHLATSLAALFARCHKIRDGCCCC